MKRIGTVNNRTFLKCLNNYGPWWQNVCQWNLEIGKLPILEIFETLGHKICERGYKNGSILVWKWVAIFMTQTVMTCIKGRTCKNGLYMYQLSIYKRKHNENNPKPLEFENTCTIYFICGNMKRLQFMHTKLEVFFLFLNILL